MIRSGVGLALLLSAPAALAQDQGPLTIPGSLFGKQSGDGVIINRIAMHKGDLLTIVVSEAATGSTTSSTSSSKQDATKINASVLPVLSAITGQFGGTLGQILNSPFQGASTGVSSATAGSGTSSTSTSFTANVTVVIKEVLPNGNLLIEGRRQIKMNKQNQTLLLEGTVRRDDVSVNNTVLSQSVADLRLEAEGKGLIANRQREGLLTKLLSWVF
jgi:flagellar L-ring protein precursor FlgH